MTVQEQFTPPGAAGLGEFTAAWRAWHARHEARLAAPHGFLAITSLHWLTETPQRFGLGEVSVTVWPKILKEICVERDIFVLE